MSVRRIERDILLPNDDNITIDEAKIQRRSQNLIFTDFGDRFENRKIRGGFKKF